MNVRWLLPVYALSFTFLIIGPIQPWSSAFPLLERSFVALVIVSLTLWISPHKIRAVILSPSLVLLIITATLSINQFLRLNIAKDWLAFLIVAGIAVLAVSSLPAREIVSSVALSGLLLSSYTLYLVLTSPQTAIDEAGLWMGAFTGKNNLALTLMFTVPAVMAYSPLRQNWGKRLAKLIVVGAIFAIILQTKSASSIVAFVLTAVTYLAFILVRKYRKSLPWVILTGATAAVVVFLNFAAILALFSKGSDLTGRLPLWQASMHAMEGKWLTGYGWSYLFGYESPAALFIWSETGQFFLHSHNELIFWFVMTGISGAALLVATYLITAIAGIKFSIFGPQSLHIWVPLGILGLTFGGITEISSAYIQGWFILVLLATSMSKYLSAQKPPISQKISWLLWWKLGRKERQPKA